MHWLQNDMTFVDKGVGVKKATYCLTSSLQGVFSGAYAVQMHYIHLTRLRQRENEEREEGGRDGRQGRERWREGGMEKEAGREKGGEGERE